MRNKRKAWFLLVMMVISFLLLSAPPALTWGERSLGTPAEYRGASGMSRKGGSGGLVGGADGDVRKRDAGRGRAVPSEYFGGSNLFLGAPSFNTLEGSGDILRIGGDRMLVTRNVKTGDVKLAGSADGLGEPITDMERNGLVSYLKGVSSFYRYDLIDNAVKKVRLPSGLSAADTVDYLPLVWPSEGGGEIYEGLLVAEKDKFVMVNLSATGGGEIVYTKSISPEGSDVWLSGHADRGMAGVAESSEGAGTGEGMWFVTPEGMESVDGAGALDGVLEYAEEGRTRILLLSAGGDVTSGTLHTDSGGGVTLSEERTLWETGVEFPVSLSAFGNIMAVAHRGGVAVKEGSAESSILLSGVRECAIAGNEVYALTGGDVNRIEGGDALKLRWNAPVRDMTGLDVGNDNIASFNSTALSVLSGPGEPGVWTTVDEISGRELRSPVVGLNDRGEVRGARDGAVFLGSRDGTGFSWEIHTAEAVRAPTSLAVLGEDILICGNGSLVSFNVTTRTDTVIRRTDNVTGDILDIVSDPPSTFWVLYGEGVGRYEGNGSGNYDGVFFDRRYLPDGDLLDIDVVEKVMWVLTGTGLGRFYKPTEEWFNYTFDAKVAAGDPVTIDAIGHEIYLGGEGLYHMDEWSGVNEFVPVDFEDGGVDDITDIDHRKIRNDGSREVVLLDAGQIKIYNTSQNRWRSLSTSNGLASNDVRQVTKDPFTQNIWIAAYGGVTKYDEKNTTFEVLTTSDGLSNNFVYTAYIDEFGVWLGTDGGGVNLLRRDGTYEIITKDEGLAADDVLKIKRAGPGEYWFCTDGGLTLYDRRTGDTVNYLSPRELAGEWVWDVDHLDTKVYVATDKGISVRDNATGEWTRFFHPLDLPGDSVHGLDLFTHNDRRYMWAATNRGPVCYDMTGDVWKEPADDLGLEDPRTNDVFFDGERVWVSTLSGVYLFTPGGEYVDRYAREDGLIHNIVTSVSRFGNVYYIATSGGVSLFREVSGTSAITRGFIPSAAGLPDISIASYDVVLRGEDDGEGSGGEVGGEGSGEEGSGEEGSGEEGSGEEGSGEEGSGDSAEEDVATGKYRPAVLNVTLRCTEGASFYFYASGIDPRSHFDLAKAIRPTGALTSRWGEGWALVPVTVDDGGGFTNISLNINVSDGAPLYLFADADGRYLERTESDNLLVTNPVFDGGVVDGGENGDEEKIDGRVGIRDRWWLGVVIVVAVGMGYLGYRHFRPGEDG